MAWKRSPKFTKTPKTDEARLEMIRRRSLAQGKQFGGDRRRNSAGIKAGTLGDVGISVGRVMRFEKGKIFRQREGAESRTKKNSRRYAMTGSVVKSWATLRGAPAGDFRNPANAVAKAIRQALDPRFAAGKVKTLDDMSPEEIAELERSLGAPVKRRID